MVPKRRSTGVGNGIDTRLKSVRTESSPSFGLTRRPSSLELRLRSIRQNHDIQFRILGPFEARKAGRPLQLGGARQQSLLAILVLHANQVVPRDRLIADLWDREPPETAGKMIQNYVSQLRKLLEPEDASRMRLQQVLVTRTHGYELVIDPDQIDAKLFERLVEEGRRELAGGVPGRAAELLREALGLWRGPVLADFVYEPFAQGEIARLEELRLTAIEDRIEADLALGRHADVVGELESLAAQHPLREPLRGHLMLALYRSGRQAEALDVYQKTRELLVDRLGIEPTPALKRLERAILLQDPALEPVPQQTISVVFVEVMTVGPRLDPEALRRPLSRALETATQVLERYGGSVERLPTDAVTAVFGIPTVHEDDALRAVRAALEMRETVGSSSRELGEDWRGRIAVRAAVNTGQVVAIETPAGYRVAAGDAIDLAARLEQAAGVDEILISDPTKRLVESSVRVESAEPLRLEGTPERMSAWTLVDLLAERPEVVRRLETPMVGRERELAELRQALERAVRERLPYLFTVLGAPGIGKSRLAAEFASAVEDEATVLTGRCLPYGEAITFWPLAEIVRQAAGDDTHAAIVELLAGEAESGLIADRIVGALGVVETANPSEETFWAARKLFEILARRRPLVLVFEDLHWGEPTLLDLVEHVADWARDAPILLVCLARPELLEDRPAWGGGKLNATSISLGPLSEREATALIRGLAGGEELSRDALQRIAEVAEGNPLFLEEMLGMLSENGVPGELVVPPTIQALLAARLDRLDPDERAALERASVIGKEFWRAAVIDVSPEEARASVDRHLQTLVRRELIRPHPSLFPADEAFRFRHILLREAAYESIPKEARAELHERFAAWLERAAGPRAREFEEIIGHHLEQAYRYRVELGPLDEQARELARRAAGRLASAGRRAYARGDLPAAVGLLSRGAALLGPGAPDRAELLVDLGEALRETGDFDRAESVLAESADAAAGDAALESAARVARLRLQLTTDPAIKTDELLSEAKRAVEVFVRLGDERRLAKAWELLAWVPWFRCRAAEAGQALQRAIVHARRAGDKRTEAQSLHFLVGTALFGPMPLGEAIGLCQEILEQPAQQRRVVASALRSLAGLKAMEGSFDEARMLIGTCRTILEDLGLRVTAASASETSGIVELLAGDPGAAERELREGYETLERMGETVLVPVLAALLAQALYLQERDDEALRLSGLSREAAAPDDLIAHVQWRTAQAKALARAGNVQEAEALAREAVRLAGETDFLVTRGDALADLAEVLRTAGRSEEAVPAVEESLRLYEQKGSVVSIKRADALLAELRATESTRRS